MIRVALALVLVLSACATPAPPADPLALLDSWQGALEKQPAVRFEVETRVDGDQRVTRYTGVRATTVRNSGLGGKELTPVHDVTVHREARLGTTDYRALRFAQYDLYLRHPELVLPEGKEFAHVDPSAIIGWGNAYNQDITREEEYFLPARLLRSLDRKAARLVEQKGRTYVLDGSGTPNSGGQSAGTVTLTVEVDAEGRIVRIERVMPTIDRKQERTVAKYRDWGKVPEIQRPADGIVAKAGEVVVKKR